MTRWEYKLYKLHPMTTEQHLDLLNHYGEANWELCASEYGYYIFKRPRQ